MFVIELMELRFRLMELRKRKLKIKWGQNTHTYLGRFGEMDGKNEKSMAAASVSKIAEYLMSMSCK